MIKDIREGGTEIDQNSLFKELLETNDFELIYKYYSMKDNCTTLEERQHISSEKLVSTKWFTEKIKSHLI